jgi:predicted RNA-binding protein with PIN domain
MTAGLSGEATAALARALGAYMRATPANELPAQLRRFKSFRPKSLTPHKDELAGALEDETLRGRIVEWLDHDRPRITKRDAEIMKLACERGGGWRQEIEHLVRPVAAPRRRRPPTQDDLGARLEREKERSKQARADVRRARDAARAAVQAERAHLTETGKRLASAEKEAVDSRRRTAAAERDAARAKAALEREQRKARRAVEKAEGERDKARAELRAARREIERLTEKVRDAAGSGHPAPPRPKRPPRAARPGRRRPLPAPKGRLEDDPATLEAWLDVPRVRLLVDGYNVTKSEGGFGALELERQRGRLVEGVGKLARRKKVRAVVVFDGSQTAPLGTSRRGWGPARVEYSRPEETADDHLVALVEGLPADPVVVVTSDRELQARARALGATVATSAQLLALVR